MQERVWLVVLYWFFIVIYSFRTNEAYCDFYSGIEIFTLSNEYLHKGEKIRH